MLPSLSLAVSRVGGGTMSNGSEGLRSLTLPVKFKKKAQIAMDDSVHLPGPTLLDRSGVIAQSILISILSQEIPELKGVRDRVQFGLYLQKLGWSRVPFNHSCLEVYSQPSPMLDNWIVGWGDGRGVILNGPMTVDVREGIKSAINSIEILPGMCAWN